jgi:hypothetical protein
MMTAKILAGEWLELFETKTTAPLGNKQFKAKYTAVASKYEKLPIKAQEEFTQIIHKKAKKVLKAKEKSHEREDTG